MSEGDMVTVIVAIGDVRHELTVEQARLLYERLRIMFDNRPVQIASSWGVVNGPAAGSVIAVSRTQNE